MDYDYSTINMDRLRQLPVFKRPPTYHLQDEPGNGCAGDPPGFPTYFTQSVYTAHGNGPHRGAELVLLGRVVQTADWTGDWEDRRAQQDQLMRELYIPLPFEHPRVQAWVTSQFQHFHSCYRDVERLDFGKPGTLIFPVPSYKLKAARIDLNWTPEYQRTVVAEAEAFNKQELDRAAKIAVPENHVAVQRVREWYPEQDPAALLARYAAVTERSGDWWERHAERPTPEQCVPPRWFGKHRAHGWCQFCGHDVPEAEAVS